MNNDLEEEEKIIEERTKDSEPRLEFALSIHEPIEKLNYRDPVLVNKNIKVIDAIKLFNEKDIGCVLVTDEKNKLTGIFTERDVVRKLMHNGLDLNKETIEKYMTKRPDALHLDDPITFALNRMSAGGYRHIPLIDKDEHPVGFVSARDIIDHLADYYSNEILNLPPSPHAKQKSQEGG